MRQKHCSEDGTVPLLFSSFYEVSLGEAPYEQQFMAVLPERFVSLELVGSDGERIPVERVTSPALDGLAFYDAVLDVPDDGMQLSGILTEVDGSQVELDQTADFPPPEGLAFEREDLPDDWQVDDAG